MCRVVDQASEQVILKDLHPTVPEIVTFLKELGYSRFMVQDDPGEESGSVITGWREEETDRGWIMAIDPILEFRVLAFIVPQVAYLHPALTIEQREEVFRSLLQMNSQMNVGDYGLDSRTGYVTFSYGRPMSSDKFSIDDFEDALTTVCEMTATGASLVDGLSKGELKFVPSTGRLEEVAVPMEEPDDDLLGQFEAWMKRRSTR